ncbi:MAG: ATP-binding protein [Candidatus Margulisbacteria bacterium]|nr:ATP-binding protein [Candidatus Margulisiibacteriota bacterium]
MMDVKRMYAKNLENELDKPFISILVGPRQVGKSTLMQHLQVICKKQKKKTLYLNLEDPRDLQFFNHPEEEILEKLETAGDVIFIDEFHYLKNATKLFKILYDSKKKIKIVASGSSAIEIHKHLQESLAGRYRKTQIFPLTLKEYFSKKNPFNHYLVFGGMPGLLHEDSDTEKMNLLNNIIQAYLLKDIKSLIKEENVRAFNHLLQLLAQNQGSVVSVANLAREIGLSEPTIQTHLEIMSQTFVCYRLNSYARNLANEIKKSKKYYLFDLGIRHSLLADFSEISRRQDIGIISETLVLLAILPQLKPNMDVKFWRTRQGEEVDFILLKNRIPYPVEVKYNFTGTVIPTGLKIFLSRYPEAPGAQIITTTAQNSLWFDGREIKITALKECDQLDYLE